MLVGTPLLIGYWDTFRMCLFGFNDKAAEQLLPFDGRRYFVGMQACAWKMELMKIGHRKKRKKKNNKNRGQRQRKLREGISRRKNKSKMESKITVECKRNHEIVRSI